MRRSRFSEEQIIGILREQEAGMKVAEVCPEALEEENRRLKKLLAEAVLDNAALKDLLGKNG